MWTQAVLPQNKSRENTENTQQGVSQGARERGVGFGVRVGGERERKREREKEKEREKGGGVENLWGPPIQWRLGLSKRTVHATAV